MEPPPLSPGGMPLGSDVNSASPMGRHGRGAAAGIDPGKGAGIALASLPNAGCRFPLQAIEKPSLDRQVTLRNRGLGTIRGSKIALHICQRCSQRNAPDVVAKGYCNWCVYEPSKADAERT